MAETFNSQSEDDIQSEPEDSRTLDYSLLYYVFDKIIQKYFIIKKSTKIAKKTVKKLDEKNESVSEDEGQENQQNIDDL